METEQKEDLAEFDNMTEIRLYFFIDFVGAYTWRMNHDYSHGRISEDEMVSIDKTIARLRIKQDRAVKNLTRFGFKPLSDEGKPTAEYWAWYKWWSKWHKDDLTQEQWRELDAKMSAGEDVSSYRPSGDWRSQVEK